MTVAYHIAPVHIEKLGHLCKVETCLTLPLPFLVLPFRLSLLNGSIVATVLYRLYRILMRVRQPCDARALRAFHS